MIKCLSLSCRFILSIGCFKAVTNTKLLFEQFCSMSVVKSLRVSVVEWVFCNVNAKMFEDVNWKWRRYLLWDSHSE